MPANASINSDGFRIYAWPGGDSDLHRKYGATEPRDVLSVTSIRSLCGTPYQLVTWQNNNIINVATGQRKAEWRDYSKSKRGRLVKGYRKDGAFPGEFATRMIETRGDEDKINLVRAWLKASAEEPRDVAAVRGSVVHKMIELNVSLDRVTAERVRERFDEQWATEDRKVPVTVTDDDVKFVIGGMEMYWDMRTNVPFVILAQEPQVWNLTAGYAGSADALIWFLPEGTSGDDVREWQRKANGGLVTRDTVLKVGGRLCLVDWKTSPDVYTGHVVQGTAYLGAEFVGRDGNIDDRLSELLRATMTGAIIKIRPDRWFIGYFDYDEPTMMAFLGSCVFARFLAFNKKPDNLFTHTITNSDTEEETDAA